MAPPPQLLSWTMMNNYIIIIVIIVVMLLLRWWENLSFASRERGIEDVMMILYPLFLAPPPIHTHIVAKIS